MIHQKVLTTSGRHGFRTLFLKHTVSAPLGIPQLSQHGPDNMAHPPHKDYENRVATTEAERIAIAAAKLAANDALNELLALFGVNRANMESVDKFKRDLMFIRDLREASEKARSRFYLTLVALFAGAFAYGIVSWIKAALNKNP